MTETSPPKITFEDVEIKRRAFARAVREFTAQGGRYHQRAPDLAPEKLAGCEVLASRMHLLDRLPKGGNYAEIGVDRGDFSAQILRRCQPDRLHLFDIDLSRLDNAETLAALGAGGGRAQTHGGDSAALMAQMPDGYFDLVYIDGDHEYDGVVRDIQATLPKLKPTGAMVFNDYSVWSPVTVMHCGVARAVHEFTRDNPWRFRFIALQSMMYNDVMLVRE